MPLPTERFKNAYSNWRYNPFTDAYMTIDKTEDNLYIPSSSPYTIQLLELPKKEAPSTVTVYCYDISDYFTEVLTAPAQGEFRVDYPPTDGKGTGLIEFNQNDAGKQVRIFYKATGSPVLEEFLNTKISWPDGTPSDRQIAAYLSSTQKFTWRDNPIRMFHEGNAVYHSSGENESCVLFRFKKAATEGEVLLELKGAKLHQAFYTELKQHNHGDGSLVGSQPTHPHGPGTLTGTQPNHTHPDVVTGTSQTGQGGNQAVTVNGGQVAAGGGDAVTITGDTANAGGSPKTYPNALKVYIDGVDKTSNILTKSGLGALGDGTSGHAFVTAGTGEMDITDLITSDGFHEIKITEPQNDGGKCLIHLEMS
jgi:hypothetical protein